MQEADSNKLYYGADLFIFPSLFEGFGMPVLEAMACGTPVIISNRTSLPEIVGDAAMLIDPMDQKALTGAIYTMLSNSSLRSHFIGKGLERAKHFSWEKTAKETLKLYEEIG